MDPQEIEKRCRAAYECGFRDAMRQIGDELRLEQRHRADQWTPHSDNVVLLSDRRR